MKNLLVLPAAVLIILSCEKSATTEEKACEKNNTTTVTMRNDKTQSYNMTIDGKTKTIAATKTGTFTDVAITATAGTCVQGTLTTIVSFPVPLIKCFDHAFAY